MYEFLSTPSGWRATKTVKQLFIHSVISIHALRVEGDGRMLKHYERAPVISIHALRVEGDRSVKSGSSSCEIFLSTPSGWRATPCFRVGHDELPISIHALRVEGDGRQNRKRKRWCYFYPRPPGGGRQSKPTSKKRKIYFYPRPPGGGRPMLGSACRLKGHFYPRPPGGGRRRTYTS